MEPPPSSLGPSNTLGVGQRVIAIQDHHEMDGARLSPSRTDDDDIKQLVQLKPWEPWTPQSLKVVHQGILNGWYANRDQSLPLYIFTEVLLGLILVCTQVPETISFSLMANMDPSLGLHGAWIIGLTSTLFGGRSGLVCGVTGSISSVTATMIAAQTGGERLVFPIIITSGIMCMIFAWLNLSWILRFISKNVMIGFCNGLAIIIAKSQLHMFTNSDHEYVTGEIAGHMTAMCLLSMAVFKFWGKVPVLGKYIPGALAALLIAILYEVLIVYLWRDTRTVSIGDIGALDPKYRYPVGFWNLPFVQETPYTGEDVVIILKWALTFFMVQTLESLMTVNVMDVLYKSHSNGDQSMFAVGAANVLSGLAGGIGGNTMIGLCGLLHRSGGSGKEAPLVCAILMFFVAAFLAPYLNYFPTAGLAGIMFIVVIGTFSFSSMAMVACSLLPSKLLKKYPSMQRRIPRMDAFILLIVTILVPTLGLDIGIIVGIILSALKFVDSSSKECKVYRHLSDRPGLGQVAVYDVVGPLFFSSADLVHETFDIHGDPDYIIVRMNNSSIMDYSGLETLSELKDKYEAANKELHVRHITPKCEQKIAFSQARLDWDEAHYDHMEIDVPRLVQFADELPCIPNGVEHNSFLDQHGEFRRSTPRSGSLTGLPGAQTSKAAQAEPVVDVARLESGLVGGSTGETSSETNSRGQTP